MKKNVLFQLLIILTVFLTPCTLLAKTFTVNQTTDAIDSDISDGSCNTLPSFPTLSLSSIYTRPCSLRAAIMQANALDGDDIIQIPAGTYTLTLEGSDEDDGKTGDLDITENLTITGTDGDRTTTIIDANGLDRVLHITSEVSTEVNLSNLTLQNGSVEGEGGGILDDSNDTLTLSNMAIQNNQASESGGAIEGNFGEVLVIDSSLIAYNSVNSDSEGAGGAINVYVLEMSNSEVSNNSITASQALGGGIRAPFLTIDNSKVTNNSMNSSEDAYGAGIYVYSVYMSNSVVSGNSTTTSTDGYGGGIFGIEISIDYSTISQNTINAQLKAKGGGIEGDAIDLTNSTVSENSLSGSQAYGAGIYGSTYNGNTLITNSTVSKNSIYSEDSSGGGIQANRLGIYSSTIASNNISSGSGAGIVSSDVCILENSILADNIKEDVEAEDCSGTIESVSHSIIENVSCTISSGSPTEEDPGLAELDDNGGPTQTQAISKSSPAYNAGDPSGCNDPYGDPLSYDQRGSGYSRSVGSACDIGAYELKKDWGSIIPKLGDSIKIPSKELGGLASYL